MGAVTSCLVFIHTGSLALTLLCVLAVGGVLGMLHGFLCVTLHANQVVSGLAMTIFGTGLSAYLGKRVSGNPLPGAVPKLDLPMAGECAVYWEGFCALGSFYLV